jgi:hypothetical protein
MLPAVSALSLPNVLADFQPIDGAFQLTIYSVILLVAAVAGIWSTFRRKPPIDTHLVKLEGAIDGLQKAVDSLTDEQKKHSSHETKISELEAKVRHLETRREIDAAAHRGDTHQLSKDFSGIVQSEARITQDKFDAIQDTIRAGFTDLYRALGKTEGILEAEKHG